MFNEPLRYCFLHQLIRVEIEWHVLLLTVPDRGMTHAGL